MNMRTCQSWNMKDEGREEVHYRLSKASPTIHCNSFSSSHHWGNSNIFSSFPSFPFPFLLFPFLLPFLFPILFNFPRVRDYETCHAVPYNTTSNQKERMQIKWEKLLILNYCSIKRHSPCFSALLFLFLFASLIKLSHIQPFIPSAAS